MCVFQRADELIDTSTNKNLINNHVNTSENDSKQANMVGSDIKRGPLTIDNLKFGVNVNDLRNLMQLKGEEAKEKINTSFGGIEQLASSLNVDPLVGIVGSKQDIDNRVKAFGKNEIPPKPPKSIFRLMFEALQDTTLILLTVCSIVSIGLSFYDPGEEKHTEEYSSSTSKKEQNLEWVEGVAIMIAVVVVVSVTAFNDWRKERQFRGLQDRIDQNSVASVIRNGQIIQINLKDIVVGDICCIKYGDLIPADGIVVQASDLKIDESSLTGESDLIKKNNYNNFTILSGTHVMEGSGKFLVIAVGINSQTGIIMSLLGATDSTEESDDIHEEKIESKTGAFAKVISKLPWKKNVKKKKKTKVFRSVLQIKLGKLALQIGYCGMLAALLAFILLVLRMSIDEFVIKKNEWSNIYVKFIISYLIQGITVIVVAVPEGLPLAVTLALAFAVRQMTKDNNLVRHLDACETMGNATTICSDKTGTLTTNRMTVVQCWIADEFHKQVPKSNSFSNQILSIIEESISINTNYASSIEAAKQPGEMAKQIGNKTECALLGFVNDLGCNYEKIRHEYPSDSFIKVYTFNSARKMMATIVNKKNSQSNVNYRLYVKGASEIVLSKCSHYLNSNGEPVPIDSQKISHLISNVVENMASEGLRTICVAYRDFVVYKNNDLTQNSSQSNLTYENNEKSSLNWDNESETLNNLTCVCLVGIEDPVRDEVPDAIRKCQTSGVVVRMITGDNIKTATSIALKCGIVSPGDDFLILESKDFNQRIRDKNGKVRQDLLDKVWPRLRVLARSSPQDKYILVNGIVESKISANRQVVAVTGDGTNDGPALKRADVGFAMGIQGTDVAKEASDIILTDDNFSSIVKAMLWGRNVYDAIAKFLQFQLTANCAAGVFSVVCAATIQAVPLKAVQMLWVNLVMDTLASLALATEPPTDELLKRAPYGRNKSMISLTMLKNIIGHSIYQLAVLFALVWAIDDWMLVDNVTKYDDIYKLRDPSVHFTIIFNAFVLMTLFNELNARKIHNERNVFVGLQNNKIFLAIWIFCFCGQILIVNFGGIVFAVERLDWDHWMWCLFFGFGSLLWGQLVVCVPKSFMKKFVGMFFCFKRKKIIDDEDKDEHQDEAKEKEVLDQDIEYIENSNVSWMRGSGRLQNQLKIIDEHKSKLDQMKEISDSLASLKDRSKKTVNVV